MCDPLTITGLALSAVSTGVSYAAQAKTQRARDSAMAAERIRQNKLDQEAQALNATSQDRYQDFEGQQEEKASSLADFFTSQEVAEPDSSAAVPTSSSNITVREEAKQRGKAKEFTDRAGTALGELRSFGDLMGGIGRLQARDATSVGQLGGFKRGSSNVLGYELDEANQAGAGLGVFGDIVGGLGSVVASAARPGASLFGGGSNVTLPANAPIPTPRPVTPASPYLTSGKSLYNLYG